MLDYLKNLLPSTISQEKYDELYKVLNQQYKEKEDPWGLSIDQLMKTVKLAYPLYKSYFKVQVFGTQHLEEKQYMMVSNHTGQIAIDGMLVTAAFLLDTPNPKLLRTMVERFITSLPFCGQFFMENGAVLGDRSNCYHLLNRGESILVFPEGVKGIAKSTSEYYQVKNFTRGFFRLALRAKKDILPIAVIGAEEFYPYVHQAKMIAKLLKLPALPITPTFPLLGPLGLIPMPSPVDIHIGKPYPIPEDLSPDAPDNEIDEHVYKIEQAVKDLIRIGLKQRREFWGTPFISKYKPEQNAKG